MIKLKTIVYIALIPMVGLWSCSSSNQMASGSKVIYDDLYGGAPDELRRVSGKDQNSSSELFANQNEYDYNGEESIDSYYDENYLSSRDLKRNVSDLAGYNAGFQDGYFAGRNFMNYGSYWPGRSMMSYNMGFRYGMGNAYFMGGPMLGWGYNRYSMWNSPYMFNSWGYDPWMMNGMYGGWGNPYMSYGFGSSYYMASMMYGGGYYNPWYYNRPVVIGDGSLAGSGRTYGPRSNSTNSRTGVRDSFANSNRAGVTSGTTNGRSNANNINNGRQSSRVNSTGDSYYARPRSTGNAFGTTGRSSSGVRSSAGNSARTSSGGNYYYAAPRSGSGYSTGGRTSGSTYSAPRSNSGYSAPSRSYNNSGNSYSTPSRSSNNSYSQPRSNNSYSAPRSTPSYSAPARSSAPMSAPSGGGGGGASRSRGPR